MRLIEALSAPGALLGDGANGTVLISRGFSHQPGDLANRDCPDLVLEVHKEYFDAGSDFVETNTFSANRFKLIGYDVDIRELNLHGAKLARKAAGNSKFVLGSIGPAGKPMAPIGTITREEIVESAAEQAKALETGGVDGFSVETFIDLDELAAAIEGVRSVSQLPILASKAFIEDGEAISGGLPTRWAIEISKLDVQAVGANCIVGPQRMLDLVRMIAEGAKHPIVAVPTPGMPMLVRGQVVYDTSPEYFARASIRLVEEGAKVIGGCCGTRPDHIREMRRLLDKGAPKVRARASSQSATVAKAPLETTPPTELHEKVRRGAFVVTVELDVPRGLRLAKFMDAIQATKSFGSDVIDISDGARARLRINPMAMCHQIQTEVGIETMMHFSCRDRNLLAIQADLLGCHALGVRNILAITGDPANIGDYPSATSVFDVDSIGLTRILTRLNEGIDLAGYSVGVKCGFTIAVAYNPMALDPKCETERLARKAEAGAHIVYTQPVFEERLVEASVEACAKHGLPVFVGVMPLRSARHAEFMHNEVPGIRVPDRLRQKFADAPDDASAMALGVEEACRLAELVRKTAQGLYLMPPANEPKVVEQVISAGR